MNEKGVGGTAEMLIILLFSVLVTGAVALMIMNEVSQQGKQYDGQMRAVSMAATYDLDGDGLLNGLILVGKSPQDGVIYYRAANTVEDYGEFGSTPDSDDDGDARTNATEVVWINPGTGNTIDDYFYSRGARMKAADATATPATWAGFATAYNTTSFVYSGGVGCLTPPSAPSCVKYLPMDSTK